MADVAVLSVLIVSEISVILVNLIAFSVPHVGVVVFSGFWGFGGVHFVAVLRWWSGEDFIIGSLV